MYTGVDSCPAPAWKEKGGKGDADIDSDGGDSGDKGKGGKGGSLVVELSENTMNDVIIDSSESVNTNTADGSFLD